MNRIPNPFYFFVNSASIRQCNFNRVIDGKSDHSIRSGFGFNTLSNSIGDKAIYRLICFTDRRVNRIIYSDPNFPVFDALLDLCIDLLGNFSCKTLRFGQSTLSFFPGAAQSFPFGIPSARMVQ